MIVKTDGYSRDQVGKVVQLRANVEGLRLGSGVLERLAVEGEKSSLRSVLILNFMCPNKQKAKTDMLCSSSHPPRFSPVSRVAHRSRWRISVR